MSALATAYRFDEEGWLIAPDPVQIDDNGEPLLPPDDTMTPPDIPDGHWARWVDGAWTYIAIPTTAEELCEAGIVVDHQSHTKHAEELRKLMRGLKCDGKPGSYRLNQDSQTNDLSIVKVPELTEAEAQLQADESADASLNSQIYALKDEAIYAILMGDNLWLADLRAQYKALMGIEDEEG